jgi:para-aminobenzoate synthetase/4-amino-4-deoxychorismate lyase
LKTYAQFPSQYRSLAALNAGGVLLETARCDDENYRSYLFTRPIRTLSAHPALMNDIEQALADGLYVAGFLAYECGEGLMGMAHCDRKTATMPLAWFGVYSKAFIFDHRTGEFEGEPPDALTSDNAQPDAYFAIRNLCLDIGKKEYAQKIAAIHEYIRAGDTYQVNFATKASFDFSGSPVAMFEAMLISQPVQYAAFIHAEGRHILSFSPELFYRVNDRRIITRPMKGTARRGTDTAEDEAIAHWLHNDVKNRSENIMIVDLLRNDLGRICEYGSIKVDRLFAVDRYETLYQMTSEVSGLLRPEVKYSDIFGSLFPCGSVTGAPKHRTIEIIQELERGPRGVYTGAIGFLSPSREAIFSVPIRTLVLEKGKGVMGVGSGIVIDSQADDEFRECSLKYEFLTRDAKEFQLLESILWIDGYTLLPFHLQRMGSSAVYFGFNFNSEAIIGALKDIETKLPPGMRTKVRVLLERSGAVKITHTPVELQTGIGKIMVSDIRVSSEDRFLRHKTTFRQLYDRKYEQARRQGFEDALFLNERGEVTETAISNIFIEKDGRWFTPPVACGLLAGTYRRHLLETKPEASERVLRLENLASADAVYLCNAVRGCRNVRVEARYFKH